MSRSHVFSVIYNNNIWHGKETPAGPGSDIGATAELSLELMDYLSGIDARSVLDAGCNECHWQPNFPGYIGVDVVPAAVEYARLRHPDRTFIVADICADPLPEVEVVFCRDALQHMSLADGLAAIENFRATGAWLLLAGTFEDGNNVDVQTGAYFEPDLTAPPFSLGEPIVMLDDSRWTHGVQYPNKYVGGFHL